MIHREGLPWVVYPLILSGVSFILKRKKLGLTALALSGLSAFFFRNPRREPVFNSELIISPADGKVVMCRVEENLELTDTPLWRIGIFMRLWDVHINRSPVTGKILKLHHFYGEKLPAFNEKSLKANEKRIYLIEREDGTPFWVIQVAGFIARRTKSFVLPGDDVVAGEPIGIIKFGSRVELFFPAENVEIYVKEGHRVIAGETVLGKLPLKRGIK